MSRESSVGLFHLPPACKEAAGLFRFMLASNSTPDEVRALIATPPSLRVAIGQDYSRLSLDDREFLSYAYRAVVFRDQVREEFDRLLARHGYACTPAPQPVEEQAEECSLTHCSLALFRDNW